MKTLGWRNSWETLAWVLAAVVAFPTLAAVPTNSPARYIIGLSPFLDKSVKDAVYRQIVGFLVEGMPLGSSLGLYDAYHLQTITSLEIPDLAAFRSGKTRANQFKDQIYKLKSFLAREQTPPMTTGVARGDTVRFPQFLDFVAENLQLLDRPTVVLVLGSPLYFDPKEPGFSMVDGYFPSDGHLLAGRDKSIYGASDRRGSLQGTTVHYGYFGDPWVSEAHAGKIRRFWELFLSEQGAQLSTFCGDLPTLFSALQGRDDSVKEAERTPILDRTQTKIEMLRYTRDPAITDWITRDTLPHISQQPPNTRIGPLKIGIRWQGNIDLDLYASPRRDAETLFFEHARSPEGYYFKDHRSSPVREFEFIEFETPVEIDLVEARVNFYSGESVSAPRGEIRIEFEGRIYSGRFELSARRGNEGRTGSSQSAFWTRIDLLEILRLPQDSRNHRSASAP